MNIRTSENVLSNRPPQKPLAAMSSRAPSCAFEVAPVRTFPVIGCRSGSMQTSLQTSVRTLAVRSLISLCLIDGKLPVGQDRACSTENLTPHPQVDGTCKGYKGQMHHEMHLCGVRNRILQWAEQLAKKRLFLLSKVHGTLE